MLLRLTVGLLVVMAAILFAVDGDGLSRMDLAALREERQRAVQLPPVERPAAAPVQDAAESASQEQPAPDAPDTPAVTESAPAEPAPQEPQPEQTADAPPPASSDTPPEATAEPAEPPAVFMTVTGNRVNVRSGPSTSNAVVTQVVLGDRVELVAMLGNGWAQIRVGGVPSDVFMSADFLSETQ